MIPIVRNGYGAGHDRDRDGLAGGRWRCDGMVRRAVADRGCALAGRIVELSAEIVVDLRATGMRVRLDSDEHAEAVSAAARDLGLAANPAVLQHLSVVFESAGQLW